MNLDTSGQVNNIHPRDLPELTDEVAEELIVVSISSDLKSLRPWGLESWQVWHQFSERVLEEIQGTSRAWLSPLLEVGVKKKIYRGRVTMTSLKRNLTSQTSWSAWKALGCVWIMELLLTGYAQASERHPLVACHQIQNLCVCWLKDSQQSIKINYETWLISNEVDQVYG